MNRLRSLTAKLFRPFRVPRQVLVADSRPGITNGFDKVFEDERWLEELLGFHAEPVHFHRTSVSG